MKITYITAHTPYGRGETFILEEMLAMAEIGVDLVIIPRNPPQEVFHEKARRLLDLTVRLPLLSWRFFLSFLGALASRPRMWKVLGWIIGQSRTLKITLKNLAVVPKAAFLAGFLRQAGVEHIHAHWGSTTATMAWVISELTGIPWSMTLHRWDIGENNLLRLKVDRATFVRCISKDGRHEVLRIVGESYRDKVKVLHMGVRVPEASLSLSRRQRLDFVIACPANLLPVKGHSFLLEACSILLKKGFSNIRCLIIGDGPLEAEIRSQVERLGLKDVVHLVGRLPHERLMQMYAKGEVDAVVLPSITTDDNEHEGIPVALMEAMAYGIPVVSTSTGGIPELISEGAGLLVREKEAQELAGAIEKLITDEELAAEIGKRGRQKVEEEFHLQKNARLLLKYIEASRETEVISEKEVCCRT